ncbi:hypothetical protein BGZ83_011981 [Gryganskiella cystojenkinii]|nr:hypothetical protein BGZ83_011981 [Gryganskiella cystojenkinii]
MGGTELKRLSEVEELRHPANAIDLDKLQTFKLDFIQQHIEACAPTVLAVIKGLASVNSVKKSASTILWKSERRRKSSVQGFDLSVTYLGSACSQGDELYIAIQGHQDHLKLFLDSGVPDNAPNRDDDGDESDERIKDNLLSRSLNSLLFNGQILFDKACVQRLEQHAGSTLRTLKVTPDVGVDGTMIHRILCSLPALESLATSCWFSAADDISEFPDRPWVCKGLRKLRIFNAPEPSDEEYQEEIYRRFGVTFKKLRSLKRSGGNMDWTKARHHLGSLHSLELFEDYSGQMTEDDVRWMTEHWTRLECVLGSPHPEYDIREKLGKMLLEHGIRRHLIREVVRFC